ncbi:hypothetical protein [Kitasatospora sp. NPDC051705]|uniref:hypothetical protein n=1 Tax=Kitasatospora sp. NPDC051705 TaxID=3364057 RepID=UPI00379CF93E
MLIERIATVDWDAIPTPGLHLTPRADDTGPPERWLSDPVEPLRLLATARSRVQVATAVSGLEYSSVMHGHMSAVFPAAVTAARFLLEIAEQPDAFPPARASAIALLGEFLTMAPFHGFHRVEGTALCCAVADLLRTRRAFLRGLDKSGRLLLQEADTHWRLEVTETLADGDGVLVFGALAGRFPAARVRAELQPGGAQHAASVEYQADGPAGEACLLLAGPAALPVGGVLRPAECGEREH